MAPSIPCILVVEDESLIRQMAGGAFLDDGMSVDTACHAEEALDIHAAKADHVHLVFTDVHMPGSIDGLQLAHHVHEHWPWIALIIASGRARLEQADMPDGARFVAKPYDIDHVLQYARELTKA